MTYSAASRIESPGQTTANQIQSWFIERGPSYAGYAPNKRYQPPPDGLGAAIVAECQRYPDHVVNWDCAAAQILHETAAWQSKYARERNNPGGIGAINSNPDLAIWFPSVTAGVRAHVAHLLVYAVGEGPWYADDPRRGAVVAAGWLGVADSWGDLGGRWAYPGTTYGQSIAALANDLLEFAAAHPDREEPPMALTDQPGYEWNESPCYGYPIFQEGRNGVIIDRIIFHTSEGSFQSGVNWLTRFPTVTDEGSSTHYFIDKDGRRKAQLVRERNAAWTAGNKLYNLRGVNIEVEGFAADGDFREGMYRELARLSVGIMSRHAGIKAVSREYFIGHGDVPYPNDHTDPGPHFDWNRLLSYVNEARGGAPMPTPTPAIPPATRDPWNSPHGSFWIPNVFIADIKAHDWMLTGYATSEAFLEGGLIVQYFERARLEMQPDGSVTRGLVGSEALIARYPERAA